MLILKNISKNIQENAKKMKAGPQNRRFASATCSKVSSATVWVKYPQQTIIIDLLSWKMCHSSAMWKKTPNLVTLHLLKWY